MEGKTSRACSQEFDDAMISSVPFDFNGFSQVMARFRLPVLSRALPGFITVYCLRPFHYPKTPNTLII